MKLIKTLSNYKLYQQTTSLELFVEVPSDQNHLLGIHKEGVKYLPLKHFLNNGVIAALFQVLKKSGIKSNVDLVLNRTHIMSNTYSVVYSHTVHYKGMIQLTIEADLCIDLIPISIIADHDGFFISISSSAIHTSDEMLYTKEDICSSVIFHEDIPRIIIHTYEPDSTFYYAACCLKAVVFFGKYIQSLN